MEMRNISYQAETTVLGGDSLGRYGLTIKLTVREKSGLEKTHWVSFGHSFDSRDAAEQFADQWVKTNGVACFDGR
jgi:hypothetical protein